MLMLRSVCATPCFPKAGESSDEALILQNAANFVQASSVPHAVCLATEGGIFHLTPSLERAAFFSLSCFIDTGGNGSLQCV